MFSCVSELAGCQSKIERVNMPLDTNARGLSAMAGLGLFVTAIVLAYLNSTTDVFVWSTIYVAGIVVASLAAASKFATALGVESGLAKFADMVASIVPWVAIFFDGIQALHFKHDGLDGFMAGIAIIALVLIVAFGVTDSVVAWFGNKYADLSEAAEEARQRVHAMSDAAAGRSGRH
jgi:hypothetical protein